MLARTTTRPRNVARKSVRFRNMRSYELSAANEGKRCLPSLTNYLQLIYVFAMSTRKEKLKMTPISEENKKNRKRKGLKHSRRPLPINGWTMMYPRTTNDLLHNASQFQQDISPVLAWCPCSGDVLHKFKKFKWSINCFTCSNTIYITYFKVYNNLKLQKKYNYQYIT